jgi:ribose/xylose/arabinose/galactoside ABC-type transport system permease subunit
LPSGCGRLINGSLIAYTGFPPFIATLGMMVSARGVAKWYTKGQPVSGFTDGVQLHRRRRSSASGRSSSSSVSR